MKMLSPRRHGDTEKDFCEISLPYEVIRMERIRQGLLNAWLDIMAGPPKPVLPDTQSSDHPITQSPNVVDP